MAAPRMQRQQQIDAATIPTFLNANLVPKFPQ
jgi:hypothetical protein